MKPLQKSVNLRGHIYLTLSKRVINPCAYTLKIFDRCLYISSEKNGVTFSQ